MQLLTQSGARVFARGGYLFEAEHISLAWVVLSEVVELALSSSVNSL